MGFCQLHGVCICKVIYVVVNFRDMRMFDSISLFVGVCLGSGAKVTLVSGDDGGGGGFEVLAIGGVGFVNEHGVGW